MIGTAVVQFILIAVVCGIGLWALSQFSIDAAIVKLIRILVIVILSVWLVNLILLALFGQGIGAYLGAGIPSHR
jgi:hypothetical protein